MLLESSVSKKALVGLSIAFNNVQQSRNVHRRLPMLADLLLSSSYADEANQFSEAKLLLREEP